MWVTSLAKCILQFRVEPQPHIIDQTFRFHCPEQTFFKKSYQLSSRNLSDYLPYRAYQVSYFPWFVSYFPWYSTALSWITASRHRPNIPLPLSRTNFPQEIYQITTPAELTWWVTSLDLCMLVVPWHVGYTALILKESLGVVDHSKNFCTLKTAS